MTIEQLAENVKTWAENNGFLQSMYNCYYRKGETFLAYIEVYKLHENCNTIDLRIVNKKAPANVFVLGFLNPTPELLTAALSLFEAAIKNAE